MVTSVSNALHSLCIPVSLASRKSKGFTGVGQTILGLISVLSARYLLRRIEGACTCIAPNAIIIGAGCVECL
jgi:hypothetical protein